MEIVNEKTPFVWQSSLKYGQTKKAPKRVPFRIFRFSLPEIGFKSPSDQMSRTQCNNGQPRQKPDKRNQWKNCEDSKGKEEMQEPVIPLPTEEFKQHLSRKSQSEDQG